MWLELVFVPAESAVDGRLIVLCVWKNDEFDVAIGSLEPVEMQIIAANFAVETDDSRTIHSNGHYFD